MQINAKNTIFSVLAPDVNCYEKWCRYAWSDTANQGRASSAIAMIGDFVYVFGGTMFGDDDDHVVFMR